MHNTRRVTVLTASVLALIVIIVIVAVIVGMQPFSASTVTVIAAVVAFAASLASGIAVFYMTSSGQTLQDRLKEIFTASREQTSSAQQEGQIEQRSLTRTDALPDARVTPSNTLPAQDQSVLSEDTVTQSSLPQPRSIDDYASDYRRRLCEDPRMNEVQILSMSWSLNLLSIYVRLRLHQQIRPGELEPEVLNAQDMHDPNQVFRAERLTLKRRVGTAIEPDQALRHYQRCIMLGDPGVGKTTMLKYLALRCAAEELRGLSNLPIFIDLNVYAQTAQHSNVASWEPLAQQTTTNPLLLFAAEHWEQTYGFPRQEALTYMHERLKDGDAMVLLDGLDETLVGTNPEEANASYRRVESAIYDLAETYNSAFIVVTARFAGYQQHAPLQDFTELEVLGFRKNDIEQFVKKWYRYRRQAQTDDRNRAIASARGNAQELIHRLNNPHLQALASTPLLLALMVFTFQEDERVLEQRTQMYERCVNLLLDEWDRDQSRKRTLVFDKVNYKRLLEEVAWHFHKRGLRYFRERDVLQVIEDYLRSVNIPYEPIKVLDEVSTASALLKKMAEGWYGFLHLTLQEYFVAEAAIEFERYDQLTCYLDDPWWEEVFVLYAGRTGDATRLMRDLWKKVDDDSSSDARESLFHSWLILAGRCLAARPHIQDFSLRMRITARLQRELMRTRYTWTREQLAEVLAGMGDEPIDITSSGNIKRQSVYHQTVKELVFEMLMDRAVALQVQISIGRALAFYGNEDMRKELVQYLYNQQADTQVQIEVAQALGVCGSSEIAQLLVDLLPKSDYFVPLDLRVSIAQSLSDLIDDAVIPQLVAMLPDKSLDLQVRYAIIESLGASGRRSAVPELLELRLRGYARSSREAGLQLPIYWRVVVALASLGERLEDAYTLLEFVENERYSVDLRREIVNVLGTLHLSSLARAMLPLVSKEKIDTLVRVSIVSAIGAIGDRSLIAPILEMIADGTINIHVRSALCSIVGTLGDRRHIESLHRLPLKKDDTYVQRSIMIAQGRLGDKRVAKDLVKWLTQPESEAVNVWVQLDILNALGSLLGELQEKDYMTVLALVQSPSVDKEVKRCAIGLLPRLMLFASTDELKRQAVDTLKRIVLDGDQNQQIVDAAHYAYWSMSRRVDTEK